MSNLFRRIFSGIIYILIFISAILFSKETYIILTTFFGLLCIHEFSKIINYSSVISYLFFSFLVFLIFKRPENYIIGFLLSITLVSSFSLIYYLFSKKEIRFSSNTSKLGLLLRYPILSMFFLIYLPFYKTEYNANLMICILILIWVNDSFAFLVGKNFGKRKLFVSVSPKKTQEGFLGGLVFSIGTALIISYFNSDFTAFNWVIIAIILGVVGAIGDLVESKFKRQAKIKDSGSIMPGHGGILDRLDSLLFAAPFVYLYIHFII